MKFLIHAFCLFLAELFLSLQNFFIFTKTSQRIALAFMLQLYCILVYWFLCCAAIQFGSSATQKSPSPPVYLFRCLFVSLSSPWLSGLVSRRSSFRIGWWNLLIVVFSLLLSLKAIVQIDFLPIIGSGGCIFTRSSDFVQLVVTGALSPFH